MALVEAVANVAVDFVLAVPTQVAVFPLLRLVVSVEVVLSGMTSARVARQTIS
jgi:hypothetical protein